MTSYKQRQTAAEAGDLRYYATSATNFITNY